LGTFQERCDGITSVYVDDALLAGPKHINEWLKRKQSASFAMKDWCKLSKMLGVI
jgi:hypothetical protein